VWLLRVKFVIERMGLDICLDSQLLDVMSQSELTASIIEV
jgi:hypothetical protein